MKYRDRVHFVVLYTIEPHPVGSASPYYGEERTKWSSFDKDGNPLGQPGIYQERRDMAAKAVEELGITLLVLVDEIDNPVWCTYGPSANIAYLIGTDGIVEAAMSFPHGAKAKEEPWRQTDQMEEAILKCLGGS